MDIFVEYIKVIFFFIIGVDGRIEMVDSMECLIISIGSRLSEFLVF